jgi:hypothetical protein
LIRLKQPERTVAPADVAMPKSPPRKEGPDAPPDVRTPGDRLRPRWRPDYNPVALMADWGDGPQEASGAAQHGVDGLATVALPALSAGAYRLRYETLDDFGAKYETFRDFVVAGTRSAVALPVVLWAEKSGLKVGDTARFLVTSGLRDQPLTFDVYREGVRVERRWLTAQRDAAVVEIPITETYRGGFTVTVSAVRDFQFFHLENAVFVPWDDKEL